MNAVSFKVSDEEARHIDTIVQRVAEVARAGDRLFDYLTHYMDLAACHANGCPLDFERMANWDRDFDLVHDVYGIAEHINRKTGKLEGLFVPRFARRST